MNLLLFEESELNSEGTAVIHGERAEHLRKILKAEPGDTVAMGLVDRGIGTGRILSLEPGKAELRPEIFSSGDALYPLCLAVGMSRPIQIKRILKTAASMGVEEIRFIPTELGENSYQQASIWDEYRRHLIEGASQGGLCFLPRVIRHRSREEFVEETKEYPRRLLFDLEPKSPESPLEQGQRGLLLIGSERGWTRGEREYYLEAGFDVRGLGRRILTTETACTAALAISLRELGLI